MSSDNNSVQMTQRMGDIAFMQRWRHEHAAVGSIAFDVVDRLIMGLRAEPLVAVGCPECRELGDSHKFSCRQGAMMPTPDAPKARVRAEVIVGILEEILLAKALDAGQRVDAPLALAGHLITKLQTLGVDLS